MYPKINIHLKKYQHNLDMMLDFFHSRKISIMVVSKVFGADSKLIDVINQSDADFIADSRIINLKNMRTSKPKVLLRLPQKSEVKHVITYTDISLNSELTTIQKLNKEAIKQNKIHQIILMFDIGDLREGLYYKNDYDPIISEILSMKGIHLLGIGTNLTCYGGVIPTLETMEKLDRIKELIERKHALHLSLISGGNSSIYPFVLKNEFPHSINNIRLGELLILGRETSFGDQIPYLYDDVFTLTTEVIECKIKPSVPEGILGLNAFGQPVSFEQRGNLYRAILAIGKQDVQPEHLICPDGVSILGASSDHLIVEIKDQRMLNPGDLIEFKLTYGGVLSLMTSKYVRKHYVR